jgi:alanine-synthesizing transaminase
MFSQRLPRHATPNAWSRLLDERRAAGAALIDLTEANPTRVGLAGAVEGEISDMIRLDAARYEPDPRGALVAREAIASYYRERGLVVRADHLVLTSGTSEAYAHLFRLLADPGESLLVPSPSYPLFEPLAALEGVRLRPYGIAWDGGWHLDLGSLEAAFQGGARAMIVVQPHHPTGSCLSSDEIAEAEKLCERHGTALISDEVFGDFPWTPGGARGLPSLLGERRVPTFVLSGLSKVCGLPQLKLSWIAVDGPETSRAEALRGLEWIADLFLSVGTPVQCALPRLLAGRHPWQSRVRDRIAANLARLRETISRRPRLEQRAGAGGWVAVLRVPSQQEEEHWALELLRRDVVVHPGHFYDMEGEAHLVVSLIVAPADFDAGLTRIEALAGEG